MLKNSMKSFVMSMKRMHVLHGGYKKTFEKVWCHVAHVSVTEYVFLCSVAEFVSWDPKMRG